MKKQDKTAQPSKKPYQSPKLTVYGDVYKLTGKKGGNKSDGGGKPSTKALT